MKKLDQIRAPRPARWGWGRSLTVFALAGAALGAASKLLDIQGGYLGEVFSQMSVWIFLCTAIAVYSPDPVRAGGRVLCFCLGMLAAYYLTAERTGSVYGMSFVYGWTMFALCAPVLGFCTWYAGGRGPAARLLLTGVVAVLLAAAAVLFDKIRFADLLFAVLTVLTVWKVRRLPRQHEQNCG